ncbi:MAG: YggS family pyridoxal phosphate-dependent enzyme [Treponema sp.]|nr:YggS family pyridoxal phosphate-dependent enzyme [Treponema sp.]
MNEIVATVAQRLAKIEERIEAACRRSGRKRQEIKLMAVTKFHPPEAVLAAYNVGVRLFGESRVKEGIEKFSKLFQRQLCGVELHFIGPLQRNKAKQAAAFYDCIQSVDREPLISELGALTAERKSPLMVMLEYHTAEETKSGFSSIDSLLGAAENLLSFPGLQPAGLMTMAPFTNDETAIRESFKKLICAKNELEKRFSNECWSCLSMGMTNDYEIAIEEGSTLMRIGTALFGESGI